MSRLAWIPIIILPFVASFPGCSRNNVLDTSKYPLNWPSVQITDAPDTIKINVSHTYVAVATDLNPAGNERGEVVRCDWDFGDATLLPDTTVTVPHTFTADGQFMVRVTVTDNDGNLGKDSVLVAVTRGSYPSADPGGPYKVKINVPLTLNGSATDSDGRVVSYKWDFDGDGTYDSSDTTGRATHTYAVQGTYRATLRTTDDDANVDTTSVPVVVTNLRPSASAGGPYRVKINVPVELYGSGSDADGHVVSYEWDFDGDGTYDWSDSTGGASHTYSNAGTYAARLRVTDDDGNTDSGTFQVTVTNLPPVAIPGGPYTVIPNVPLMLNGSGTDPDGRIVGYEWDLDDDGVYEWSSQTGEATHAYTTPGTHLARLRVTDDDGNQMAREATVFVVYDITMASYERVLTGHTRMVYCVTVTHDGQYVLSASDSTVKMWRISDGILTRTFSGHGTEVLSLAVTPGDEYLVSGSATTATRESEIRVWRISDGATVRTLKGHAGVNGGHVRSLAVTPDGQYIVSGSIDKTVKVWRIADGALVTTLLGHTGFITSVAVTPDGHYVLSGAYSNEDKTIRVWETSNWGFRRAFSTSTGVYSLAITPDGETVVSGTWSGIELRRISDGLLERRLSYQGSICSALAVTVTPDGRYIVSGDIQRNVSIWRIADGSLVKVLQGHMNDVYTVAVSPDEQYIVSGSSDGVRIWRAQR